MGPQIQKVESLPLSKGEYVSSEVCKLMHSSLSGEIKEIKAMVEKVLKILNGNGVPGLVADVHETKKRVEVLEEVAKEKEQRTFQEKLVYVRVIGTFILGGGSGAVFLKVIETFLK